MNNHNTPDQNLRALYMEHLLTPIAPDRKGTVAGKGTRRGMRKAALWADESQGEWDAFRAAWAHTPERVWIWSDHHLGHENIIKYTDRPFGNAELMDEALLHAAQIIPQDDWVMFAGDLAMWKEPDAVRAWVSRCPGKKVLVLGNHDCKGSGHPESMDDWRELGFLAVSDSLFLPRQSGGALWITHYPLFKDQIPSGALNVHGHTHTSALEGPYLNVCVEPLGYMPHRLVELLKSK